MFPSRGSLYVTYQRRGSTFYYWRCTLACCCPTLHHQIQSILFSVAFYRHTLRSGGIRSMTGSDHPPDRGMRQHTLVLSSAIQFGLRGKRNSKCSTNNNTNIYNMSYTIYLFKFNIYYILLN